MDKEIENPFTPDPKPEAHVSIMHDKAYVLKTDYDSLQKRNDQLEEDSDPYRHLLQIEMQDAKYDKLKAAFEELGEYYTSASNAIGGTIDRKIIYDQLRLRAGLSDW